MGTEDLRRAVLDAAVYSHEEGLVRGTSGNWSRRDPRTGIIAIKPSSLRHDRMTLEDVVLIDLEGKVLEGKRKPSSEYRLHLAIYRAFPDIHGVAHTHSPYATCFAAMEKEIPPVQIEAQFIGPKIPVAAYGAPGSEEVGQRAVEVLGASKAALLAKHGVVAMGATLEEAVQISVMVEDVARVYYLMSSLGKS